MALRDERAKLVDRVSELEIELQTAREELEASHSTTRRLMRERNLTNPNT
jgi:hypothetical protein